MQEQPFSTMPQLAGSLSIVLPAYNEAPNLMWLIPEIVRIARSHARTLEVVLINDGSTDNSATVAKELMCSIPELVLVSHENNMGYGCALRTGISSASCEWTLLMDADGQLLPTEISPMIGAVSGSDCVLGIRIERQDSPLRKVLGRLGNWMAGRILGFRVLDVNCGLKLFRTSDLKAMTLRSTGGIINTEILRQFLASPRSIRQLTVAHRSRIAGAQTGGRLRVISKIVAEGSTLLLRRPN
jgi:glycosyltransferase involved in cell wall biosynthesis